MLLYSDQVISLLQLFIFRYGQPESEIEKYVDKITSADDKYDFYMDLRYWQKAADVAVKTKDEQRLIEVFSLCIIYQLIFSSKFLICVVLLRLEDSVTTLNLNVIFKINYQSYEILAL